VSSLYTLLSLSASVSGSVEIIIYTSLNLCSSLPNNLLRSNDLFSTQDGHQRTLCKQIKKPMCFSRCSYIDLFDREYRPSLHGSRCLKCDTLKICPARWLSRVHTGCEQAILTGVQLPIGRCRFVSEHALKCNFSERQDTCPFNM